MRLASSADGFRGQMAVLVKPNGRLGRLYMAAIRPCRHTIVYPPLMREIAHDRQTSRAQPTPARA